MAEPETQPQPETQESPEQPQDNTMRPQVSPPVTEDEPKERGPEETRQELKEAIEGANEVLVSATTVFTFFPDTLTLDRAKLTVIRRTFLNTAEVLSMRVEDILNVNAAVGPFFGSVKVVSRILNPEKPYVVARFWREDALRVKRIIQGYVIAMQRNIDCSALPLKELTKMLDELGHDDHPN